MGVLFALCDLRVSNQDSWRITHTLVRDCLNMTKSSRANIAQRWRQYTAGRPTEVPSGELRQVKGQPIERDRQRQKKGCHAPFSVQHLVTNGHVNKLSYYRAIYLLQLNKKKLKKHLWQLLSHWEQKRGCTPLNLLVDFNSVQDSSCRCAGQTLNGWVLWRTSTFNLLQ